MLPFHYPCINPVSVMEAKAENRVLDGPNAKVWEMKAVVMQAFGNVNEYCFGMCDEINIKSGVKYHSTTAATIGSENDVLDISSVLHRLLSR